MAKSGPKTVSPPARTDLAWKISLRALLALSIGLGAAIGLWWVSRAVERTYLLAADPPQVVLKNRPAWMTDFLATQIAQSARPRGAHSALDHDILRNMVDKLQTNPWVRQVRQVRRVFGQRPGDTLEIDCEYRTPVALVAWGLDYYLVDGDAVLLPEKFSPKDLPRVMFTGEGTRRQTNIRVVEAVKSQRPVEPGQKWAGADLAAGLGLARLLCGQSCAEEITRINVENFAGRKDNTAPQLVLKTLYNTEIRWGEPVDAAFHVELAPQQKLKRLAAVREQYGRVDAKHSWLDIRFDRITCPVGESGSAEVTPQ